MNQVTETIFQRIALGLVGFAIFAFLPSCSENEKGTGTASDADNEVPAPHLTILTWDEYFSLDVVQAFETEFGVKVQFETFENLDEMEGLLRSRPSNFDLILTSSGKMADLISMGFVQPIQRGLIPLFGNLDSRFMDLAGDPGNQYSIPYMWGPALIAYRSDKIPDPEPTWRSLWDDRYRGHILMLDETFDVYAAALLALGHDLNSRDPEHLDQATKLLMDQVEKLDTRFVGIFEARDKLLSGECWITMTYSSDAAVLAEKDENIDYFVPDEGAVLWLDSFVIPREAQNVREAHLFLDYFCRPEVAAANSNELWCASANSKVRPYLSSEILADDTIYLSADIFSRCHFEAQSSPERQRIINQGFKRLFDLVRVAENSPTDIISETDEIGTAQ